jgi:hypothetical protein
MRPRAFLLVFLLVGVLLPILALQFVQPLSGDLTRIGRLPERAFGWNTVQEARSGRPSTVELGDADILIVGDSFSISGAWQAYAFSPEQRYATLRLGRLCVDFPQFVAALGAKAKTLIVEVVERNAHTVLGVDCAKTYFVPLGGEQTLRSTREQGILGGVFGFKYVFGAALYYLAPGSQHRAGADGGVWVRDVDDGCALLSNRDCQFGLFLGNDFTSPDLGDIDLKSNKLAALKVPFERLLVVVVPNKSSVYLESRERAQNKDGHLRALGQRMGVDVVALHVAFYDAKSKIKDLYLPDNTHLSTRGYRELANLVVSQGLR